MYTQKKRNFRERTTETTGITVHSKKLRKEWWRRLHDVDLNRHWRGLGVGVPVTGADLATPAAGWGKSSGGCVEWIAAPASVLVPVAGQRSETIYRQRCCCSGLTSNWQSILLLSLSSFFLIMIWPFPTPFSLSSIRRHVHTDHHASFWQLVSRFRVGSAGLSLRFFFLSLSLSSVKSARSTLNSK